MTAVLDKVDDLKSVSAKRRHLLAALDAFRGTGDGDPTHAKNIEMLEAALRELEAPS